jgi:hypothetical protein
MMPPAPLGRTGIILKTSRLFCLTPWRQKVIHRLAALKSSPTTGRQLRAVHEWEAASDIW